jgi:hypothetical protein
MDEVRFASSRTEVNGAKPRNPEQTLRSG